MLSNDKNVLTNDDNSGKLSFLIFVLPYGYFHRNAFERRLTCEEGDREALAHSDHRHPLWKRPLVLHERVRLRFLRCVFNSLWEVYLAASILLQKLYRPADSSD